MDTRERVRVIIDRVTGLCDRVTRVCHRAEAVDDTTDAILAIFAEEREAVPVTSVDRWEMEAKAAEAREAKLVELLVRLRDYLNEVNDDHRYYNDDTEPLINEIDAALDTVKEGK